MLWANLSMFALMIVGLLLILIILLQRGRGGGLAGAFGGLGGQSAFGTKAGDVFTKITVVLTVIWVALAGASIWALENSSASRFQNEVVEEPPAGGLEKPGVTEDQHSQSKDAEDTSAAPDTSDTAAAKPASEDGQTPAAQESDTGAGTDEKAGNRSSEDQPVSDTPEKPE